MRGKAERSGGLAHMTGVLPWMLYAKEQLGCMELGLGMSDEPVRHLVVKMSRQTNTGDIVVGICYR